MAGGFNYRDLGGLSGANGKKIVMGKFFRADELSNLTQQDLAVLNEIPITTVVDFRTIAEAAPYPDKLPLSVKARHHLWIEPGNLSDGDFTAITRPEQMVAMMENIYRHLVSDSDNVERYRQFFAILQQDDNLPLLYHCTAGKDRTGIASALILASLGADRKTIFEDYLVSNICLEAKYRKIAKAQPALAPGFFVTPDFLTTAFKTIDQRYGSLDAFLSKTLEVDSETLRAKYLH